MSSERDDGPVRHIDPSKVPIRVLFGSLTTPQLWSLAGALSVLVVGGATLSFQLGKRESERIHSDKTRQLEQELAQARAQLDTANKEHREDVAKLREDHQKRISELQDLMRKVQEQIVDRQKQGLTLGPAPSRFKDYRGFPNLIGFWRGTAPDGYPYIVELKPQDSDEILARLSADSINCQMSLKLFRATDDQLTTSNYFFRPVAITPNCPALESLMLRPFEVQSDVRWTMSDGRVSNLKLYKRL